MRRNGTDAAAQRRKKDALHGAVSATAVMLLIGIGLPVLCHIYAVTGLGSVLLTLMGLGNLLGIIPVWILLKQRWKEIEGGEEDAAAQY